MRVGFIGLGTMGAHMALNVRAAGHELVVHDMRREAAAPHLQAGAAWAEGPCEVAAQSEVVFTSLPGPREVEAVADGLIAGMQPGTAWFDLSTNWESKPASSRWRCGPRCARARSGACAPSTGWAGSSCRAFSIRRISR